MDAFARGCPAVAPPVLVEGRSRKGSLRKESSVFQQCRKPSNPEPMEHIASTVVIKPKRDSLLVKEKAVHLKKEFREHLDCIGRAEWHQDLKHIAELKRCIFDIEKPKDFLNDCSELCDVLCEGATHPVRQMCETCLEVLGLLCQLKLVSQHRRIINLLLERCVNVKDTVKKVAEQSLQLAVREGPLMEIFQLLMVASQSKNINVRRYANSYILEMVEIGQPVPFTENLRRLALRDLDSLDGGLRYASIRLKYLIEKYDEEKLSGLRAQREMKSLSKGSQQSSTATVKSGAEE